MSRLPDWPERLELVLDAHRDAPFEWGENDCLLFAGRAIEAVTGDNPAQAVQGTYSTARGATKALWARGFKNVGDALADLYPEISPAMAQRGDLAVVTEGEMTAAGVVVGERVAVLAPAGLAWVDLVSARRAFQVG